jgi:predicted DNA-binding transcriptional regulator AlpA
MMYAVHMAEINDKAVQGRHLAGVAELSGLFGVGRTTISNWHARSGTNGFPDPVAILAAGPVWDANDVITWHALYTPQRSTRKAGTTPATLP